MHHASIRTANIHRAIAFYEHLGFCVRERFTTGATLACWLEGLGGRIELIQIPEPHAAPDTFGDEHYVGFYHLSFDLTTVTPNLPTWLDALKTRFTQDPTAQDPEAQKLSASTENLIPPLRILLEPTQQLIGDRLYEVAFIADSDGLPLELIRVMSCATA